MCYSIFGTSGRYFTHIIPYNLKDRNLLKLCSTFAEHLTSSWLCMLRLLCLCCCVFVWNKATYITPTLCWVSELDAFCVSSGSEEYYSQRIWHERNCPYILWETYTDYFSSGAKQSYMFCVICKYNYVIHVPCLCLLDSTDGDVLASQCSFRGFCGCCEGTEVFWE